MTELERSSSMYGNLPLEIIKDVMQYRVNDLKIRKEVQNNLAKYYEAEMKCCKEMGKIVNRLVREMDRRQQKTLKLCKAESQYTTKVEEFWNFMDSRKNDFQRRLDLMKYDAERSMAVFKSSVESMDTGKKTAQELVKRNIVQEKCQKKIDKLTNEEPRLAESHRKVDTMYRTTARVHRQTWVASKNDVTNNQVTKAMYESANQSLITECAELHKKADQKFDNTIQEADAAIDTVMRITSTDSLLGRGVPSTRVKSTQTDSVRIDPVLLSKLCFPDSAASSSTVLYVACTSQSNAQSEKPSDDKLPSSNSAEQKLSKSEMEFRKGLEAELRESLTDTTTCPTWIDGSLSDTQFNPRAWGFNTDHSSPEEAQSCPCERSATSSPGLRDQKTSAIYVKPASLTSSDSEVSILSLPGASGSGPTNVPATLLKSVEHR